MPQQNALMGHNHDVFPRREVMILVLCVAVNAYTLANLFPYVGIMVKELMGLESINDAGETMLMSIPHASRIVLQQIPL